MTQVCPSAGITLVDGGRLWHNRPSGVGMTQLHVAVIETQSNQPYIFATNRQAAALGASQLLWDACSTWVHEATGAVKPTSREEYERELEKFIDESDDSASVFIALSTSGRAVLLSRTTESLRSIIGTVTGRAIREAPGLGLAGGISHEPFDWHRNESSGCAPFWTTMRNAQESLRRNWAAATKPAERFLRLPPVRDCALSSLPASVRAAVVDGHEDRSSVVHAQIAARDGARARITHVFGTTGGAESVDEISGSWHAVFHADSNGFGSLFSRMGDHLPTDNHGCLVNYRNISTQLAQAADNAARKAVEAVHEPGSAAKLWYPIVFGGDDLTVILASHVAVRFAVKYLLEFERLATEALQDWRESLPENRREGLPDGLSASGGLAFAKPSFPFHASYDLAEDLIGSAKESYRPTSSGDRPARSLLDLHVLYESSDTSLAAIRDRRRSRNGEWRHGGPYLIGDQDGDGFERLDAVTTLVDDVHARLLDESTDGPSPLAMLRELREGFAVSDRKGADQLERLLTLYPDDGLLKKLRNQNLAQLGRILTDVIDLVVTTRPSRSPSKDEA